MLKIDSDATIHITRGDSATINVTATDEQGQTYTFESGSVINFRIMEKKNVSNILFEKSITLDEDKTQVEIDLESSDTEFEEIANKPITYWYEIEQVVNEKTTTIVGYDEENGAKLFIVYPEGKDD